MSGERRGIFARLGDRLRRNGGGAVNPIVDVIATQKVRSVFQPIVDIESRTIFAYEALARSLSPHFDGPLPLFSAAVENGRVGELGRLLRMLAVDGCTEWPLFLNVNPNEFGESWLVRPDDPIFWHEHQVYMEITESVPLERFEQHRDVIAELRSKGIKLAVDDLGAGFSNLRYISDLVPDFVKLDRDLIVGMPTDPRRRQLVRSVVTMCGEMGAKVVAEGIETLDELKAAVDAGVRYGQGYLFARPAAPPPEAVFP